MSQHSFTLGSAHRFYSLDRYAEAMGLRIPTLTRLLNVLGVPWIEIGKTRLVNHAMMEIALHAVSRIGQPNFLCPGSKTIDRGHDQFPRNTTTTLDLDYVRQEMEAILLEIALLKKLRGARPTQDDMAIAREAADRMIQNMIHLTPARALRLFSEEAERNAGEVN